MITNELYNIYLKNLLSGKKQECAAIVQELLKNNIQLKDLYENLFQRSLYEIGLLWESNKISVAVEHIATSITENLINLAYPLLFSAEHIGKKAVITCTPGEYHQIGASMVADFFELNGWDGYFLGANTPIDSLIQFIEKNKPDLLAISLSVYFNINALLKLIKEVHSYYPDLLIIIGGQGFNWGGKEIIKDLKNTKLIRNLAELEEIILKKEL